MGIDAENNKSSIFYTKQAYSRKKKNTTCYAGINNIYNPSEVLFFKRV